jgi:hypothetical protein
MSPDSRVSEMYVFVTSCSSDINSSAASRGFEVDSTSASRGFTSDALNSSSRSKLDIVGDGASTLVATADEVDLAGEVDIVGEEAREGS